MIFFITVYSILALEEPHIKDYLVEASKSGQPIYKFVKPVNCSTGKLKNTYVIESYKNNDIEGTKKIYEDIKKDENFALPRTFQLHVVYTFNINMVVGEMF